MAVSDVLLVYVLGYGWVLGCVRWVSEGWEVFGNTVISFVRSVKAGHKKHETNILEVYEEEEFGGGFGVSEGWEVCGNTELTLWSVKRLYEDCQEYENFVLSV